MGPIFALCALTLFVWAVAIVATLGEESEGTNSKETESHRADETEERKAA